MTVCHVIKIIVVNSRHVKLNHYDETCNCRYSVAVHVTVHATIVMNTLL